MNKKPIWKFTIKRSGRNELFFGFTYADSEEEARINIINSIINTEDKLSLEIINLTQVKANLLTCIIGGAKCVTDVSEEVNDQIATLLDNLSEDISGEANEEGIGEQQNDI